MRNKEMTEFYLKGELRPQRREAKVPAEVHNEKSGTKKAKRSGAQGTLDMHVVKRPKK